jgi:hypothetical protein
VAGVGEGHLDNLAVLGVRAEEDPFRDDKLDFQTPKKQATLRASFEDDFGTLPV